MLDSIRLDYNKYLSRITPILVNYDDERNIIISEEDDKYLKNSVEILVNALADVHMNREIRKATLNNTVTALKWFRNFGGCQKGVFIFVYFYSFCKFS